MFVKPCPECGRNCKITEGAMRNGHRFYIVGCPNYCWVLKPQKREDKWKPGVSWITFEGDYDYNTMYKKWNEELIE
jgi:hypothetical protein